jgi:tRNA threonylcarbamoyladenosine biosynthesis protein TsaE
MITKNIIYTNDQVGLVVSEIIGAMQKCSILTLKGPLGAGKTTLVRALLRACGVDGYVQSPTFVYMQVYTDQGNQTFHHFDLYRIATLEQFQRAGFDEYLCQNNSWAIIEWPEVIESLLTMHSVCEITLAYGAYEAVRIARLRVIPPATKLKV